jgi:transcriptional regulator with XRE-family HTH domain
MNRVQESLSQNLKMHRKRLGLTQEQLAERCDLTAKYVTALEIGRRFPSPDSIVKLASALGVKPYQFFLEERDIEAFNRDELLQRFGEEIKAGIADLIDGKLKKKGSRR